MYDPVAIAVIEDPDELKRILRHPGCRVAARSTGDMCPFPGTNTCETAQIRPIGALTIQGLPDPDDAPFAEVATMGGVPLVTGNVRHFPGETVGSTSVLTPRQFIDTLGGRAAR